MRGPGLAAGSMGACGAVPAARLRRAAACLLWGLAAAPDRPLNGSQGSLALALGWPPASSPKPTTENAYGNTRERLTTGIAPAVKWPGFAVK